jgi:hypothetical protein
MNNDNLIMYQEHINNQKIKILNKQKNQKINT